MQKFNNLSIPETLGESVILSAAAIIVSVATLKSTKNIDINEDELLVIAHQNDRVRQHALDFAEILECDDGIITTIHELMDEFLKAV